MNIYKITGKVHYIGETITFPSGFSKRMLVIDCSGEGDKYNRYVAFDFKRDRANALDSISSTDTVEVAFSPEANENSKKPGQWFTSLSGIGIEVKSPIIEGCADDFVPQNNGTNSGSNNSSDDDDFPF